ncbi:Ovostatin-like [Homarus americanus]|uniref:Ovostatin-like n=1 Tax=Homarus americanus TaxID=6706 RepID=A0A8J5JE78_HOMAM|nr:Ovostatin-like [Homarus americanus]
MKGGVDGRESPVPLTAYVMVALLEAGEDLTSVGVKEAIRCITSHQVYDPYVMSLKAYALALANMPEAEAVIQDVVTMVNEHKIPDKFFINGKFYSLLIMRGSYYTGIVQPHQVLSPLLLNHEPRDSDS